MAQGKITPNIGQTGVKSIRLGGMTIDDLPIGEAARAKMQLPRAEEDERQAVIDAVRARYPKQGVDYLRSRIQEARGNIAKFREQLTRLGGEREQYRILLHDARQRENGIEAARGQLEGEALRARIKELTVKHGPWQVEGLKRQIGQFGESIERFEATIEREQTSIDELTELLGQCRARDKELTRLGA
jgi:chromosome segregation ATPase